MAVAWPAVIGGSVPAIADPCPTTTDPVPTTTDPVPTTTDPVPTTTDPTLTTNPTTVSTTAPPTTPESTDGPWLKTIPDFNPPTAAHVHSYDTCESDTVSTTAPTVGTPETGTWPSATPTTVPRSIPTTTISDTDSAPDSSALWLGLMLLCGLAIAAGVAARAWRHRGLKFLKNHVSVAPRHGSAAFDTHPSDGPDPDHILAVVPTESSRSTTVEEV